MNQTSALTIQHVIGTVLDRVYDGKTPISGVQTYAVPAGGAG